MRVRLVFCNNRSVAMIYYIFLCCLFLLLRSTTQSQLAESDGRRNNNNDKNRKNRQIPIRRNKGGDDLPLIGHLIPHSHCDAAYKKTVNEYYETEVRYILDNVVDALLMNNNMVRRFVWAETIFLSMWWKDPRTKKQDEFRRLLQNSNDDSMIEIVNGGWVMHDEAITRYDSQIRQMKLGHDTLQELLGFVPEIRTGWQIDPFGAASQQVNLHDWAHIPFLVHNRIPQYLKDEMMANQSLEFLWNVPSTGTQIFVHILDHHYETPRGYDWENLVHVADIITDKNVQDKSDYYMQVVQNRSHYFVTPNVLMPFGGDFHFVNASRQFDNMDRIIDYVNSHPERYDGATLRYSTPQEYYQSLFDNDIDRGLQDMREQGSIAVLPNVTGSPFLPYWTGYYTQLPILKQMVRTCEILLHTVQMNQWLLPHAKSYDLLQKAQETVAMMQHHDAITSTSYRFVLHEYMKRLQGAFDGLTQVLTELVVEEESTRIEGDSSSKASVDRSGTIIGGGPYMHETVLVRGAQSARTIDVGRIVDPEMGLEGIDLLVLNSLDWEIETLVSFVSTRPDVAIVEHINSGQNRSIMAQSTPLEREIESPDLGLFLISFKAKVARFGKQRYSVHVCRLTWATDQDSLNPPTPPGLKCAIPAESITDEALVSQGMSSHAIQVTFDQKTNDLSQLTLLGPAATPLKSVSVSHDVILYNGTNDTIYDMRTGVPYSDPEPLLGIHKRRIIEAYRGVLFSQVTLELNSWLKVRYRVITDPSPSSADSVSLESLLEVSMIAGPIPPVVNVASRFRTDLGAGTKWFYDENGFLPVQASYNSSLGVGYSLRPLVARTWLVENETKFTSSSCSKVLTVHSVDPHGVVSHLDGAVDVVWKRRNHRTGTEDTDDDDWWKEGEDFSTSRSSLWLTLNCLKNRGTTENSVLPLSSRKLALQLSNDVIALQIPRGRKILSTPNIYSSYATAMQSLLKQVHILSVDIKDDCSQNNWLDMLIENLSEEPGDAVKLPIAALLPLSMNSRLEGAELRSLTFLYRYGEEGEKAAYNMDLDGSCGLIEGSPDTGGNFVIINSRSICAVRLFLSSKSSGAQPSMLKGFFHYAKHHVVVGIFCLIFLALSALACPSASAKVASGFNFNRWTHERIEDKADIDAYNAHQAGRQL